MIRLPKRQTQLLLGLVGTLVLSAVTSHSAALRAAQLSDGTTVFDNPPRLVEFTSLRRDVGDRRSIYYVTVDLPPDSGESLKALQVILTRGKFFPRLRYRLDEIEVLQGDRRNRGAILPIESTDYNSETKTLTVRLREGIAPGQRITFALKPVRNPSSAGIYLFEVTATPEGDRPRQQKIGFGRISIFDDRDPD